MDKIDTITIPRLDGERAERYEARTLYITMGANRSLDAVSQKLGKSKALMERWSSADNWTEHAARYDETVYTVAARDAAEQYRADLAAHRKRSMDASKALYTVAGQLLQRLSGQANVIDLSANTLSVVRAAFQTSLDLEAHALGIDQLMPSLTPDDSE